MGISFVAASPWEVFDGEYAEKYAQAISSNISMDVPLGRGAPGFRVDAEMGWDWWQRLQKLAIRKVGLDESVQIRATDAWRAVYVEADVERLIVWPDGKPEQPLMGIPPVRKPWYLDLLRLVGLSRRFDIDYMMVQMVGDLGARHGELQAMQIGNLSMLHSELTNLARELGYETTLEAIEALLGSYSDDEDRWEQDEEIQCLCHAWLTSYHALQNGTPMWLCK